MLSTSEDCFHSKVGKLLKEFWYQWILKYGGPQRSLTLRYRELEYSVW